MSEVTAAETAQPTSKHAKIAERIIGGIINASSPAVSPDGTQIVFVVSRVDLPKNKNRSQIWIVPADGSSPARPLTTGEKNDSQPRWSPDGRSLAFVSSRGEAKGESTLHVLPMGGPGEIRTLATRKHGISSLNWSPNGEWLAFNSRTPDKRYDAEDESWQPPRKIERFFTQLNGEGWVYDRPEHVYVVPASGTAEPRNLTPGPFQHHGTSWLTDSSAIVTAAARHDTWDRDLADDLHIVSLSGEVTTLTSQTGTYFQPSVSPDGKRVAFIGADDPLTNPQNCRVGVLTIATGEHIWASAALDRTFEVTSPILAPVWIDDNTIVGNAEDRGRCHLHRVAADGATAPIALTSGARWVRSWDYAGGTYAVTVSNVDRPAELYSIVDGAERQLTHLTDDYVAAAKPQAWERFAVPTTDGTAEIDAWIMKPADLDDGARCPVILNVHGGPHTQYGETYFDEAQFQVAAGFVVVMCNPRGSSGREQRWGQAILGPRHPNAPGTGWGSVDLDDVLAVLDAAVERYPVCDPDRVGMQGGSYGGYMATMLAGRHGHRFKGICSERAVNNLTSEEWNSDIATIFRVEHGPNHLDAPEEYERMSPIRYVRDITVPMLIVHSEGDLRCPISQAEELFVALRLLNRDVTFYRFPGENHELSRSGSPVHRVQRAEIILDWFAAKLA